MTQSFLIIGDTNVARRVMASLQQRGKRVHHLVAPTDDELRTALQHRPSGVAVLAHNDVIVLRYALATAHIDGDIAIVATIFDRTVAEQLNMMLPQCITTSPAELAAASLAGPCCAPWALAKHVSHDRLDTVVKREDTIERISVARRRRSWWRMRWTHLTGLARSPDQGTRMLVVGLSGLLAILLSDWVWLTFGEHQGPAAALVKAVRVVATVGPATDTHGAHAVAASIAMLLTILLTAMFTAGVVDRLLSPRLTALLGPRVLPRFGHVIVVGLGQVGLRLCRELAAMGIDVVVERNPAAENLRLMRELKIPVVIGHGEDRGLLERLRAHRACAIAAVGSDDLDNIAVAIAAQAVAAHVRLVLRAGEHEAIAESRSLLPLGIVRDVASISAAYVVSQLLGEKPLSVIADGADIYLEYRHGQFVAVHEEAAVDQAFEFCESKVGVKQRVPDPC